MTTAEAAASLSIPDARPVLMSFLGFPIARYIDIEDSEAVLRAIQLTDPDVPIDLILHTPGGLVLAATQIADALRAHPSKVTVFVPHYAMSGATVHRPSVEYIPLPYRARDRELEPARSSRGGVDV
jgi:Serine dehydrogenase proteinase